MTGVQTCALPIFIPPKADTTTIASSVHAPTTFFTCDNPSAEPTDDPPNFNTFIGSSLCFFDFERPDRLRDPPHLLYISGFDIRYAGKLPPSSARDAHTPVRPLIFGLFQFAILEKNTEIS